MSFIHDLRYSGAGRMNSAWQRLIAIARKEVKQLKRDPKIHRAVKHANSPSPASGEGWGEGAVA